MNPNSFKPAPGLRRFVPGRAGCLAMVALSLVFSPLLRAQEQEPGDGPQVEGNPPANAPMPIEILVPDDDVTMPADAPTGSASSSRNGRLSGSNNDRTRPGGQARSPDPRNGRTPSYQGSRSQRSRQSRESNLPGYSSTASGTNDAHGLALSDFNIVTEKNIFNANRRPRPPATVRPGSPAGDPTEYFRLVGTMTYEKGTFAFFDGPNSAYRKVLQLEGTIAGFKLANISPEVVSLVRQTNTFELRVGMSVRRNRDGSWRASPGSAPAVFRDAAALTGSPTAALTEASAEDSNEILKRMTQRREQE